VGNNLSLRTLLSGFKVLVYKVLSLRALIYEFYVFVKTYSVK
jgi:hypothetical protein